MSSGASSTGGAPPILKLYVHTLFRGTGNTETLKRNVALLLCVHNKPMAIQSLARTCSVEKDVLRSTTQSDTSGVYAIDPATDTIDLHHDVLFHNGKAMLQHTVHCVWHPIDPAAWALNETATLIVQSQSLESPAASLFSINASQAGD